MNIQVVALPQGLVGGLDRHLALLAVADRPSLGRRQFSVEEANRQNSVRPAVGISPDILSWLPDSLAPYASPVVWGRDAVEQPVESEIEVSVACGCGESAVEVGVGWQRPVLPAAGRCGSPVQRHDPFGDAGCSCPTVAPSRHLTGHPSACPLPHDTREEVVTMRQIQIRKPTKRTTVRDPDRRTPSGRILPF
jgi:hypothetical protein